MGTAGIVIAATTVASASVPSLPHRTAAQLLAEAGQAAAKPLGPLTATVQETADLGLPQLPAVAQPGGSAGLATGNQSITIWYRDPQHIRIAEPVPAGESDLRLSGRTLWLWDSKTQTATRVTFPARITGLPDKGGNGLASGGPPAVRSGSPAGSLPDSPLAAANQVLKAVGPATVVGVQSNVYVANRPSYQLSLVPRSSQSLVGQVLIAIDASRGIPLRVEVFGRGSAGLAYSVGFTSLTFGTPAASNFSFTPPPGATVKREAVPGNLKSVLGKGGLGPAALGLGGLGAVSAGSAVAGPSALSGGQAAAGKLPSVPAIPKQALAQIKAQFAKTLPKNLTKAQRAQAIKAFDQHFAIAAGSTASNGGGFFNTFAPSSLPASTPGQAGAPKVIGKDWLSVIATPANPAVAAAVKQMLSQPGGSRASGSGGLFGHSSSGSASATSASASGSSVTARLVARPPVFPLGPDLAALRTVLIATTPVHGSWGSGRLLQTKLLSVLITSKGQILAGAVSPAVLYADVAADAG